MVADQPPVLSSTRFDPESPSDRIKDKLLELAARDHRLAAAVTELPGHSGRLAVRQNEHKARESPPQQRVAGVSSPTPVGSASAELAETTPSDDAAEATPSGRAEQHTLVAQRHPNESMRTKSGNSKHRQSASSSLSARSKRVSGIDALRNKAARLRLEKAKAAAAQLSDEPTPDVLSSARVVEVDLPEPELQPEPELEPEPEPKLETRSVVLESVDALRRVSAVAAAAQLTPIVTPGDKRIDRLLAGNGETFECIPLDGRTVLAGGQAVHVGTAGQSADAHRHLNQQLHRQEHQQHQRNQLSPRSSAMASASDGTPDRKAHVEDGKAEVATPYWAGPARHPYLEQYQASAAKHAATTATGRPTLRSTGGRRVPSALRIAAPASTSGTGAAVVNTILNQKHTAAANAAALPVGSQLDKRTLGMATKIRAKAVAHMADRELQYESNARRKVVRFASKDMQQHNDDHLRSVPAKVR